MKIKDGFILRNIADTYMAVPVAQRVIDFKGIITLNAISASIWEFLKDEKEYSEILDFITSSYEVDEETAKKDLDEFIIEMKKGGVLDE